MKKIIIIVINLFLCAQLGAQERFYEFLPGWINPYIIEYDQGYITMGLNNTGEGQFNHNYITNQISFDGSFQNSFETVFDTTHFASIFVKHQVVTQVGNQFLVAGFIFSESNVIREGLLSWYNEDMSEMINYQTYQLGYDTRFKAIINPNDSTLIIGVTYKEFPSSQDKAALLNLDMEGNIRWQQDYPCEQGCSKYIQQVTPISDGGYVLTIFESVVYPFASTFDDFVHGEYIKIDSEGVVQWSIKPGDYENYALFPGRAVESADNNILISYSNHNEYTDLYGNGSASADTNDSATVFLEKYSLDSGELIFSTSFIDDIPLNVWDDNRGYPYQVSDMIPTPDGNVLITGTTQMGGFLIKASEEGDFIWFREHLRYPLGEGNGSQFTWILGAVPTSDGGYICSGKYQIGPGAIYPGGFISAFALKVDEYGCLEPGCQLTDDITEFMVSENKLVIYPNPSNGVFNIQMPFAANGTIQITNMIGQEIFDKTVTNQQNIEIDLSKNDNGIYLINFLNELGEIYTSKIILSK